MGQILEYANSETATKTEVAWEVGKEVWGITV